MDVRILKLHIIKYFLDLKSSLVVINKDIQVVNPIFHTLVIYKQTSLFYQFPTICFVISVAMDYRWITEYPTFLQNCCGYIQQAMAARLLFTAALVVTSHGGGPGTSVSTHSVAYTIPQRRRNFLIFFLLCDHTQFM